MRKTLLNVYNFTKKNTQEAKGQVLECYRKQLLQVQKKAEQETVFSEKIM
jgi:hypothetical protein